MGANLPAKTSKQFEEQNRQARAVEDLIDRHRQAVSDPFDPEGWTGRNAPAETTRAGRQPGIAVVSDLEALRDAENGTTLVAAMTQRDAHVLQRVLAELNGSVAAKPHTYSPQAVASHLTASSPSPTRNPTRNPKRPKRTTIRLIHLDGLEVTQEVQDMAHSVPLVAGKKTVVRAYLSFPNRLSVRGELQYSRSLNGPWTPVPSIGQAELDPSRCGSSNDELRSRRADLRYSLNFVLPTAATATGPIFLRLGRIRRTTSGSSVPSVASVHRRVHWFVPSAPLRLRLVTLSYTSGGVRHTPSAADVALFRSWLTRAYPTSSLVLSQVSAPGPTAPFGAAQVNAQLAAMRAIDVALGTDARTHYYAMVSDGGFFMRGLAAGIPGSADPSVVCAGPTGSSTFGWDTDGSYGDWYGGHELGHTFGRPHAGFCGAGGGGPYPFPDGQLSGADEQFVGLDTGDPALGLAMTVMGGVSSHDMMSYCSNQWLSSFTYTAIYDRLIAENALPAGLDHGAGAETPDATAGQIPGQASAQTADQRQGHGGRGGRSIRGGQGGASETGGEMRLIASVNFTQHQAEIAAVLPSAVFGASTSPDDVGGANPGEVRVRVLDHDNEVLVETPVSVTLSSCSEPDEDITGTIDATIPEPDGGSRLEVLIDGTVMASTAIGGAPGEIRGSEHGAAAGFAPADDGVIALRWDVADNTPAQHYAVQISSDGGRQWSTVAVGLNEPVFDLPIDGLPGDQVEVRLMAMTGTGPVSMHTETVPLR